MLELLKLPTTKIMRLTFLMLLSGLILSMLPGCSQSDRSPLGKVSGTVSYRGRPIASGTLIFEVRGARSAYGKIVAGKIAEVTTYKTGDGAPLGQAAIAVFATEPDASAPNPPGPGDNNQGYLSGKSVIPAKYSDPSTSGLTHEIIAGDNNLTLDLQ